MPGHRGGALQRWRWMHPEWWSLVLAVAAGLVSPGLPSLHGVPAAVHHGMERYLDSAVGHALIMTLAMMIPLVIRPLRTVAERSLWRRREQALAWFLAAYLGRWVIVALPVSFVLSDFGLTAIAAPTPLTVVGILIAAVWQIMPAKQGALEACERTIPLAPTGWPAVRDDLRYGWMIGGSCVISCWGMMLITWLRPHDPSVMAGVTSIMLIERYFPRLSTGMAIGARSLFTTLRLGK